MNRTKNSLNASDGGQRNVDTMIRMAQNGDLSNVIYSGTWPAGIALNQPGFNPYILSVFMFCCYYTCRICPLIEASSFLRIILLLHWVERTFSLMIKFSDAHPSVRIRLVKLTLPTFSEFSGTCALISWLKYMFYV